MSGAPNIAIDHVSHAFTTSKGTVPTLDGVSLDIERGSFVSVVGPSGCGKSTLLNVISGLVVPERGTVSIDGSPVHGIQSQVGYMFARDGLMPWRTAAQNVEFGLELRRNPARRQMAQELLTQVGLSGFEGHYRHELSQGMRQRVAVARTFATDPEILLMDEPFGALDAQTRMLLQDTFLRIWEEKRKTVLFVTHDLVEAIVLSDVVVIMSHRPARIKRIVTVDIPRPRTATNLRFDQQFQHYFEIMWNDLKTEVV